LLVLQAYNPKAGVPYDQTLADHLQEVEMSRNMKDGLSWPQRIACAGCGLGILSGVGALIYIGGKLSRLW
jgi:hypothetical protein